ncbi:protoporphyrinogen oxidase [Herbiconiux daphne]|uniref:Coproporphyrinogen III oxidase n=1 Tax=Herbiconiux daphne TaxID=2970914 RepID=A0ABT2H5U9_9MICO|nr:protoporphyrinogen oxidase [Herbiconiux daphne]MCS5735322.1 protoporphyrinogen oxidase [Herbiconiux daphne]
MADPQPVDVVVIGGGVAGLVVARQLAHLGQSVVVVEARDTLGGFVATHEVAGVRLDSGAESFATRKGTVAALATDVGLADAIVTPNPAGAWVAWNGGSAPLPAAGILGIPGVPLADDVRRVIGWRGALRAYLDRLMPIVRVRPETDLGDIVRRRMGRLVLERLVLPVVAGVHSADPSVVDVHTVAPGLTQAMTTQGSLSGAVMALREQAPAGSQVQGIAGGMFRLIEALEADCRFFGVQFRTGTRVAAIARSTDAAGEPSGFTVDTEPADSAITGPDAAETLQARAVVVATGFRPGLELLGEAGLAQALAAPEEWPDPASVTLATLVIDDARLDARPRGTGVLVAPGTPGVTAKAITHSSAKWEWLADSLPAHRHVLRLSYGRRNAASADSVDTSDGQVVDRETAVQDASALLGVPLADADVAGFAVTRWDDSLAFATVGHKARVRQALDAVAEVPGLEVVGAWVSGTGLAATVEHARSTASGLAAELRGDRRIDGD